MPRCQNGGVNGESLGGETRGVAPPNDPLGEFGGEGLEEVSTDWPTGKLQSPQRFAALSLFPGFGRQRFSANHTSRRPRHSARLGTVSDLGPAGGRSLVSRLSSLTLTRTLTFTLTSTLNPYYRCRLSPPPVNTV